MDNFYPFVGKDTDYNVSLESLPTPAEVGYDFLNEQNTNELVYGLAAIKVWSYLAIKTQRNVHQIYTSNYGSDHEELIGVEYTKELTESEAFRYINECLMVNPYIKAVNNLGVERRGDTIYISVEIITEYGSVKVEV